MKFDIHTIYRRKPKLIPTKDGYVSVVEIDTESGFCEDEVFIPIQRKECKLCHSTMIKKPVNQSYVVTNSGIFLVDVEKEGKQRGKLYLSKTLRKEEIDTKWFCTGENCVNCESDERIWDEMSQSFIWKN